MRIINKTPWRTDHLRAFAMEVAKRTIDPEHRKGMVIEFRNSRSRGVAGRAYLHEVIWSKGPMKKYGWCRYAKITLPTGKTQSPNKRALASVLEHEMLHTIGIKHPGEHSSNVMRGHYDDETLGDRYTWADAMPLEHT